MAASTACGTKALLASVRAGADALCRLATEREWTPGQATALAAAAARAGGVDLDAAREALCARALCDPRLLTLPPRAAADALVRILAALAPVRSVSLWVPGARSRALCTVALGEGADGPRARRAAETVLAGRGLGAPGDLLAVPVRRWESRAAVLVIDADPADRAVTVELADDTVAALAVVLEREALLESGRERERLLVESSERRLARLAFDIHDGPLQTVASLGLELGLLGAGAGPGEGPGAAHARGLHERVAALEAELRELTHTLEPTTIARRPLVATLADQVAAFGRQHGVAARLDTAGDVTGLTPSQRIALVRVVNEALTNARDHGGATDVHVEVRTDRRGVHVRVADNGCGFDVGRTLPAAARKGRLGLVGMSERVRLLGGRLDVESRAGGPTTIVASLPWWSPVAAAAEDGTERESVHAAPATT